MKKNILLLLAVFILIFSIFTGCKDNSGLSIEDRIKQFVSDLNKSDRSSIYKDNFSSSSPFYNGSESTLSQAFPKGPSYSVSSISGSGSTRTVKINGASPDTWTFSMKDEGEDDWYIYSYN